MVHAPHYHTFRQDVSSSLAEPKSSVSEYHAQRLAVEFCQYRAAPEPLAVPRGHQ